MKERDLLLRCLREIEQKLSWGSSRQWTNNEYSKLSNYIQESTKLSVSTSSLRRLYSMLSDEEIQFNPQSETKNALAGYLGYSGWAAFTEAINQTYSNIEVKPNRKSKLVFAVLLIVILLAAGIIYLLKTTSKANKEINSGLIQFEGKHLLGNDLPHTVVVRYDVSAYPDDIFFINFGYINPVNGKKAEPIKLTNIKGELSYSYNHKSNYYITICDSKNNILKQLTACIKTEGWEGYIYQEWPAHFFDSIQIFKDGLMQLNKHNITDNSLDTNKAYRIFFRNNGVFNFSCDKMELNTRLRGTIRKGIVECSHIQLELFCDSSRIHLTFMKKGCEGYINSIEIGGDVLMGSLNDMSGFTFDIASWNNIRIRVLENKFTFYINEMQSYQYIYKKQMGKLNGIRIEFFGDGAVDYLNIKESDSGEWLYNEDFQ